MVGQIAHLASFTRIPGCRVLAIAELRPELGQLAAARFGIPTLYRSHYELLQDPRIEAIVVCTRRHATAAVVRDALLADRHVLSEKPMAQTLDQAVSLVALAQSHRRQYAIGFMKRHDIGISRAKEALRALRADGELGRLVAANLTCFAGDPGAPGNGYGMSGEARPDGIEIWPTAPDWLPTELVPAYDQFLNVFLHDLNLLRHLVEEKPHLARASLQPDGVSLVDLDFGTFSCALELANGASGDWQETIAFRFEHGALEIALPPPLAQGTCARFRIRRSDGRKSPEEWIRPIGPWAFFRQAENYIAAIDDSAAALAPAEDCLRDHELCEAIWRSAAQLRIG